MTKPIIGTYPFNYNDKHFELNTISSEGSDDIVFIEPNSKRRVDVKWSEQGRCYNIVAYDELGNPDRPGKWRKVTEREGAIRTACMQLLVNAGYKL